MLHDFYTQFGKTKIFVRKMHEGYGLVCHRVIIACCQAIGIKNLHAKVEGSTNVQNIIKAFFIGLLRQVPYNRNILDTKFYTTSKIEDQVYFFSSNSRDCDINNIDVKWN